jgi:hypothetical protein
VKANLNKTTKNIILCASLCFSGAVALTAGNGRGWPNPQVQTIEESTNVVWLESIANSLANAEKLHPTGRLGGHAKDFRTAAYARLGALGTADSLAAIERIEQSAKGQSITPKTFPLGVWTHPCWHFADAETVPLAQAKMEDGKTYAILSGYLLGGEDLFLISTATPENPASWSRPVLLPGQVLRSIREPRLTAVSQELLEFTFLQETPRSRDIMEGTQDPGMTATNLGKQKLEIHLADVLRDTDKDGWTDIEEQRLGLDPNKPDTDGDGLADGMDPCPNFAPPKGAETNENAQILQRAVFATFGLSGSRYLLIAGPSAERIPDPTSEKIQVWGYLGPIIYREDTGGSWRNDHGYGGIFVSWRVTRTGDEAKVTLLDYEGALAGSSQYVLLKKIGDKWYVVGRQFGGVS